jgi:hypothetical protein
MDDEGGQDHTDPSDHTDTATAIAWGCEGETRLQRAVANQRDAEGTEDSPRTAVGGAL